MWRILPASVTLLIRAVALTGAIIAFYLALFTYEDEEGRWQDRIENYWIAINDKSKNTASLRVAIFNKIGFTLNGAASFLFGKKLLSYQAIITSVNLSAFGYGLFALAFTYLLQSKIDWILIVIMGTYVVCSSLPGFFPGPWALVFASIPPCFVLAANLMYSMDKGKFHPHTFLSLCLSVLCDFTAILIARRLFSSISEASSNRKIANAMAGLIATAGTVTLAPLALGVVLQEVVDMGASSGYGWHLVESRVGSVAVVQVEYRTPIKPTSEKCCIRGIRGTGCRYTFAARRDAPALSFFVAREMS